MTTTEYDTRKGTLAPSNLNNQESTLANFDVPEEGDDKNDLGITKLKSKVNDEKADD